MSLLLSFPLRTNKLNCPDDELTDAISQRILSAVPNVKAPCDWEPELFMISPSDSVSSVKELDVSELITGVDSAELKEPLVTLVTNTDSPPFWK